MVNFPHCCLHSKSDDVKHIIQQAFLWLWDCCSNYRLFFSFSVFPPSQTQCVKVRSLPLLSVYSAPVPNMFTFYCMPIFIKDSIIKGEILLKSFLFSSFFSRISSYLTSRFALLLSQLNSTPLLLLPLFLHFLLFYLLSSLFTPLISSCSLQPSFISSSLHSSLPHFPLLSHPFCLPSPIFLRVDYTSGLL